MGDLPGWRQVFRDDFNTDVPLGSFPDAVSSKWGVYPSPWRDTSGYGTYSPDEVVSIDNGVLNEYIHTEGSVSMVAALTPKIPGTSKYGRYAVRFRVDKMPGYKMAWMLWPDSDDDHDGEIDFPERNLDSPNIWGFVHRRSSLGDSDQDWFREAADATQWHTTVIEWSPGLVVLYLDGAQIGRSTERIPNTPMHWVLQTETALSTHRKAPSSSAGNVQIDWVAAWAYDTDAGTASGLDDESAPTVKLTSPADGATVSDAITMVASAVDDGGVTAVKWYVDKEEAGYDGGDAPWQDTLDTNDLDNGDHTVFVKARDTAGNWGTSDSIDITVRN